MLSLGPKRIIFHFLFSCLENQTAKHRIKTIPTLGLTCSHRGTPLFPAWEYVVGKDKKKRASCIRERVS